MIRIFNQYCGFIQEASLYIASTLWNGVSSSPSWSREFCSMFGARLLVTYFKVRALAFLAMSVPLMLSGCGGSSDGNSGNSASVAPTAESDRYTTGAGLSLSVAAPGVLANDAASGNGTLRAILTDGPEFGSLDFAADGSFTYRPGAGFSGYDSFRYKAAIEEAESAAVTVNISFPNVILMLVDDMGQGDTRVYNSGSAVAMPNLEALAAAGMRFDHAHSSSALCSPTRYSVLTGNYPYRGRTSRGVWDSYEPQTMILQSQETIADAFRQAGYRTGFVGKLHNGGAFWNVSGSGYTNRHEEIDFTRPFDRGPMQFGFEYSFVLPAGLSAPPYAFFENDRLARRDAGSGIYMPFDSNTLAQSHFNIYADPKSYAGGGLIGQGGAALDNYDSRTVGPEITAKAVEFILNALTLTDSAAPANPFFLYFAPPQAHSPWTPPDYFNVVNPIDTSATGGGKPVRNQTPISARTDTLLELDTMLGAITDVLAEHDALRNTLIIFTSDNGSSPWDAESGYDGTGERRDAGNRSAEIHRNPQGIENGVPLRGYKQQVYEGGHRVPLLARWGDGKTGNSIIQPGSSSAKLVGLQDFAATFYSLLGITHPSDQANDSVSFLQSMIGNPTTASLRSSMIVQGSPGSAGDPNQIDRAYYSIDSSGVMWKLLVNSSEAIPTEIIGWKGLYRLSDDPGESTNLLFEPDAQGVLSDMQSRFLADIAESRTSR